MAEPTGKMDFWSTPGPKTPDTLRGTGVDQLAEARDEALRKMTTEGVKKLGALFVEAVKAAHRAETAAHAGKPEASTSEQPEASEPEATSHVEGAPVIKPEATNAQQ